MSTTYTEALEASKAGPICVRGRWYAASLVARDEADAHHLWKLSRPPEQPTLFERANIGDVTDTGDTVYTKRLVDGELTVDVLRITRKQTRDWSRAERRDQSKTRLPPIRTIELLYDETPANTKSRLRPVDELVRDICRHLAGIQGRIEPHQREIHETLCALADRHGRLTANPSTPRPYIAAGDVTVAPVGAITTRSVTVSVGTWVSSHRDLDREPDTPTDGGYLYAFDAATRTYSVLGGPGRGGSELVPRLLPERAIHMCVDAKCPMCPAVSREGRRLYRACLWWIGVIGAGPLNDIEYRQINVATTILSSVLS